MGDQDIVGSPEPHPVFVASAHLQYSYETRVTDVTPECAAMQVRLAELDCQKQVGVAKATFMWPAVILATVLVLLAVLVAAVALLLSYATNWHPTVAAVAVVALPFALIPPAVFLPKLMDRLMAAK